MKKLIETDLQTFIKFWLVPLGIALAILFLWKASVGLIMIGISIFLALALRPLVRRVDLFLQKHFGTNKKHNTASAILAYAIIILIIGTIIGIIGPVVVDETTKFVKQLPTTFEQSLGGWDGINDIGKSIGIENLQAEITATLKTFSENFLSNIGPTVISSVSGIGDAIMKIILVLVLTLLLLLEGPQIVDNFWSKVSVSNEEKRATKIIRGTISKMTDVVSNYVSHQVGIALIDGSASAIIVFILALIFGFSPSLAIPMGLIGMVFFLIPMFGQFISAALITLILLFSNPAAAIIYVVIYIVYSQIENNVIAPKIQGSALHLPAVAILSATTIGMYMFGLLGAIIAIPIAGCIRVFIDEYPKIKSINTNNE